MKPVIATKSNNCIVQLTRACQVDLGRVLPERPYNLLMPHTLELILIFSLKKEGPVQNISVEMLSKFMLFRAADGESSGSSEVTRQSKVCVSYLVIPIRRRVRGLSKPTAKKNRSFLIWLPKFSAVFLSRLSVASIRRLEHTKSLPGRPWNETRPSMGYFTNASFSVTLSLKYQLQVHDIRVIFLENWHRR